MKLLAIRNSALGDVAMTLPVLYSVAEQYPDTDFYLLTRPFFSKIFINRLANLHIIEFDAKGRHRGFKGLMRLVKELNAMHFDAVADLHNILRSWIIDADMLLHGKKVAMVDKRRSRRLGRNIKLQQPDFIERYADVFDRLGYPVQLDFRSVFGDMPTDTPVPVADPAVGIAPFARYANKTYPPEQMRKVVENLSEAGVNVYLFGARGNEAEILESWAREIPNCTSVAGKTDIAGELALMHRIGLMVTMDSANHHLASVAGARVISIWGSTAPVCGFNGYHQRPGDAIVAGLDCQPCTVAGSDTCPLGTMACLRVITPDDITRKILGILKP